MSECIHAVKHRKIVTSVQHGHYTQFVITEKYFQKQVLRFLICMAGYSLKILGGHDFIIP
jgi:hypothetical protein